MTELMRKAWLGWMEYTDHGKLAALLLAALLFLWFGRKKVEHKTLRLYATAMTVCCILPPQAAVLMAYQTKFYDYVWIWSLVPLTAVTAWGIVLALGEIWPDFKPGQWRRGLPGAALLLAAVLLCGPLGRPDWSREGQAEERAYAYSVLEEVQESCPEGALCLWAPREIMEYAREADGGILLPYGRNMWDASLNGYAYDVYDENIIEMYRWMEELEGTSLRPSGSEFSGAEVWTEAAAPQDRAPEDAASQDKAPEDAAPQDRAPEDAAPQDKATEGAASQDRVPEDAAPESGVAGKGHGEPFFAPGVYGSYAVEAGVTCILLPQETEQGIIRELEKALQVEARKLEGYWMLYGWTD